MQTLITVNTLPTGYVYVGPNYQYKTLTQAFAANQFQVIIPDEYVMEDTLVFNQDIIYSLTILDEIKIDKLNINTDGTGLYIIFDGHGVVTFTSADPFVYYNSTTGLALYFNSSRVNSTVPTTINATFLQASNTRFASEFAITFNKFTTASCIMSLIGCQFTSDVTLLDPISTDSFTVNCISCQFEKLTVKATKETPLLGSYLAIISLDSCIIEDLYLEPDGSKILTPSIKISNCSLINISTDLLTPCTLYTCTIDNCGIGLTSKLPNLYFTTLTSSIIEDEVNINSIENSSISSTLFNENVTVLNGIDSTNILDNTIAGTLSIASTEDSNIAYNTLETLDIGLLNRTSVTYNTITNALTTNNVTSSNIGWNTLPALSATTISNSNVVGHKYIIMELDTITNCNIESNIGLDITSNQCDNSIISTNVLSNHVNITTANGLTFSNNSTDVGQYMLNITTLLNFAITSNRLLNPNIVSATNGTITSNIYGLSLIGISSNVANSSNILV